MSKVEISRSRWDSGIHIPNKPLPLSSRQQSPGIFWFCSTGTEPRALPTLGKWLSIELHPKFHFVFQVSLGYSTPSLKGPALLPSVSKKTESFSHLRRDLEAIQDQNGLHWTATCWLEVATASQIKFPRSSPFSCSRASVDTPELSQERKIDKLNNRTLGEERSIRKKEESFG